MYSMSTSPKTPTSSSTPKLCSDGRALPKTAVQASEADVAAVIRALTEKLGGTNTTTPISSLSYFAVNEHGSGHAVRAITHPLCFLHLEDDTAIPFVLRPDVRTPSPHPSVVHNKGVMDLVQQAYALCDMVVEQEETDVRIPSDVLPEVANRILTHPVSSSTRKEYLAEVVPRLLRISELERELKHRIYASPPPQVGPSKSDTEPLGDAPTDNMADRYRALGTRHLGASWQDKDANNGPATTGHGEDNDDIPVQVREYLNIDMDGAPYCTTNELPCDLWHGEGLLASSFVSHFARFAPTGCDEPSSKGSTPAYMPAAGRGSGNRDDDPANANATNNANTSQTPILGFLDVQSSNEWVVVVAYLPRFLRTFCLVNPDTGLRQDLQTHGPAFGIETLFAINTAHRKMVSVCRQEFHQQSFESVAAMRVKQKMVESMLGLQAAAPAFGLGEDDDLGGESEEVRVKEFLRSTFVLNQDPDQRMRASALFDMVVGQGGVCRVAESQKPAFRVRLSRYLKDLGLDKKRFSDGFYYYGMRAKTQAEIQKDVLRSFSEWQAAAAAGERYVREMGANL